MPSQLTTALLAFLGLVGVMLLIAGVFKDSSDLTINGGVMILVFAVLLRGSASSHDY